MKSSQWCLCIKVSVRNLSLTLLRNIIFVSFFFEKWFIGNMKMHSNWKYSCHENAKWKTLIFSAFVRTLGSHEWSLYDFYSSCNSFFSRLIFDVYTSCDGLASNTVNILRVAFFRAPQKQRKIRAMRKCTSCVTSFFFCHFLFAVNANKIITEKHLFRIVNKIKKMITKFEKLLIIK